MFSLIFSLFVIQQATALSITTCGGDAVTFTEGQFTLTGADPVHLLTKPIYANADLTILKKFTYAQLKTATVPLDAKAKIGFLPVHLCKNGNFIRNDGKCIINFCTQLMTDAICQQLGAIDGDTFQLNSVFGPITDWPDWLMDIIRGATMTMTDLKAPIMIDGELIGCFDIKDLHVVVD